MTTFINDLDDGCVPDGWTPDGCVPLEPFEVDGIVYYPGRWSSIYRPPMVELRTDGDCYCAAEDAGPWDECPSDGFRWLPGRSDIPALRFGGAS